MGFEKLSPKDYIKKFTQVYRKSAGISPPEREAACVAVMTDSLFVAMNNGDLLAGKLRIAEVGFSPEPLLARSVGYFFDEVRIRAAFGGENADDIIEFWKSEETRGKIFARFDDDMSKNLPEAFYWEYSQAAFPLFRVVGIMLDYDKLLRLGICGLKLEICERKASADSDSWALLDSMLSVLDVLSGLCGRYAEHTRELACDEDSPYRKHLLMLSSALEHIASEPPRTFLEAMQLGWLYSLISGALNYGRMDVYLGDFLVNDLDRGTLSENDALALICSLWRQIAERNTVFHGRVIIGGRGRRNEVNADRFARLAIKSSRIVTLAEPQLSLRFYEGQNPELMSLALECLSLGTTYPILYNDNVNIPAVEKAFGICREEAEDYVMFGCGEFVINHRSYGSPNGVINLLKALEIAISNGRDLFEDKPLGLALGEFESFADFDTFYLVYLRQIEYYIEILARQQMLEYQVVAEEGAFLFISMLYDDCIARAKPVFGGGIRYLGGTLETYGNINTANALYAIKSVVYEQGKIEKSQLLQLLKNNFKGHEPERQMLFRAEKFGNDLDGVDSMAIRLHRDICEIVARQAERVGLHSYLAVIINNEANTVLGRFTAASPDGRKSGESMANAVNPYSGTDRNGLTAMLNSLVKIESGIHAGTVQNLKLSCDMFEKGLASHVLQAYFASGGSQLMLTVLSRSDLENAMLHPEQYGHILVRVGGFSARFVTLSPDVQREILTRTLY